MADKNHSKSLRIGIVGMGAIGSTLAVHLIDAGAHVIACDVDQEKIETMKSNGIRLEGKIKKQVDGVETCLSAQELGKLDLDLAIVAVKTPNLTPVVSILAKSLPKKTFVMCAQNGLDNEREVARIIGENRTLRMSINFAGGMSAPNVMNVVFFNPPNYVAAMRSDGEPIARTFAELLNSQRLDTEISDDIRVHTWKKAILNAALSPVCAITGRTMKGVMDFPDGLKMVDAILEESIRVAEADGVSYGEDFHEFCLNYLSQGGHHKPSMLVDLENGLMTEIDYLNGRIADYGRKYGLPTYINETISALIRLMEIPEEK